MTVEDQARAAVRAERRRLLRRHRARLAAAGLGRSRGGLTSKVHLAADRRRRPLAFVLTPGQAADSPRFEAVLERVRVRRPVGRPRTRPEAVAADKAYSSRANRSYLRRRRIRAWRGRYDKTPDSYMAGLQLRGALIWLRSLQPIT